MPRKPKQKAPAAEAKSGSWKWIILAGVVLGVSFACLGYLLSEDGDSIALALADDTPPKMVRIPGAAFVKATGYVTVAEQKPDPKKYPWVPEEKLVAGSAVFYPCEASLHGPWDT